MSKATLDMRNLNEKDSKRVSAVDTIDKAMITQGWEPAALYVFGDKNNLKVSTSKCEEVKFPLVNSGMVDSEYPDIKAIVSRGGEWPRPHCCMYIVYNIKECFERRLCFYVTIRASMHVSPAFSQHLYRLLCFNVSYIGGMP